MSQRTLGPWWHTTLMVVGFAVFSLFGVQARTEDSKQAIADELDRQHEMQEEAAKLKARVRESERELRALQLLNQRFCQRLDQLRTECAPIERLIPETVSLGCAANTEDDPTEKSVSPYRVTLEGGEVGRRFFLQANGQTFISSEFVSGEAADLAWTSHFDANRRAPRILNLTDMRLRVRDGAEVPAADDLRFELSVNGQVVATRLVGSASGTINVDLGGIRSSQNSPACKVAQTELARIRQQALQDAAAQEQVGDNPANDDGLSVRTRFVTERVFRAIFRRYPVAAAGEDFSSAPLNGASLQVSQGEIEQAARTIIAHPSFEKLLPGHGDPVSDFELAKAIGRGIYQGILDTAPDEETVEELAQRVLIGQRAAVIAELVHSEDFQNILSLYTE